MTPHGFLNQSVWGYIGATLVSTHLTIASVTIFLHRHQAHRSLTLHPIASHLFRFWLWLTTGIVKREWIAVHRKHHTKRDTDTLARFRKGTPDDWLERRIYGRLPSLGHAIMASLDSLLCGAASLVVFAVQMLWIPFWAAGVVNGLAHFWGYRNLETKDASHNLSPLGLLIGGKELQVG